MRNFYDEMIFRLNLPPEETVGYRVTLYAGRGVVVEDHKGVTSVADNEIIMRLKGAKLHVTGEKLSVTELNGDEAYIKGNILSIEVDNG